MKKYLLGIAKKGLGHIYKDWDWDYKGLSRNPAITIEFVERHPDKDWCLGAHGLSSNSSITVDFVERHPDKFWYWGRWGLSNNSSITVDFVERHLDKKWVRGSGGLSSNPFTRELELEKAARLIQKYCHNWLWKPLCKDGSIGIIPRLMLKNL